MGTQGTLRLIFQLRFTSHLDDLPGTSPVPALLLSTGGVCALLIS